MVSAKRGNPPLEPNDFIVTIELSDAYMTLPIEEESRSYLCFQFQDQMFQFCVLPFGLNDAPRAFTKTLKPLVGTFKISRFQDSSVSRRHYSSCIYKGTLYLPVSDS